jgi:hypothetical protein
VRDAENPTIMEQMQESIIEEAEDGAFWSECYQTIPESCMAEFKDLVNLEEWPDPVRSSLQR